MAEETKIQGVESGRAKFAWECVKKSLEDTQLKKKEYKSYVKKIPEYIKTNGLGATFAFMFSKKDTYSYIGEQITEWLKKCSIKLVPLEENVSFEILVEKVISLDSPTYRALTIEVLAFLNWLRRFAEGLIEEGEGNEK